MSSSFNGLRFNAVLLEVWRELEVQNLRKLTRIVSPETLAAMPVLSMSQPSIRETNRRKSTSRRKRDTVVQRKKG
jgi:hypothetical protein